MSVNGTLPTPTPLPLFDDGLRIALMNNYNSQTTAHAGYILALAVGIATILYQIKGKSFFKDYNQRQRVLFYIPLSILSGGIIFTLLRTIFWAWIGSEVLPVPTTIEFATPVMFNVQNYLIHLFLTETHGWASLSYCLNDLWFASSIVFLFLISFATFMDVDFVYHLNKNKERVSLGEYNLKIKGRRKYIYGVLALIPIVLLIICIIFPSYTIANIQNWLIQNTNILDKFNWQT